MALQKFIRENNYISTDWHDMASVRTQLQHDGNYAIPDTDAYIATEIYNYIKNMVSKEITVDTIKEIMNGDKDVRIDTVVPTKEEKDGVVNIRPNSIEIFAKSKSGLGYQPYFEAEFTNVVEYRVDEIEEENVAYIVSEHIVNPGKGLDLLERVYHEPFLSSEEAVVYQQEQMKIYYEGYTYHDESGFKIFVVDKEEILQDSWYKDNMLALDYIKKLGLNADDYRFYRSAHDVVEALQKQVYEAATKYNLSTELKKAAYELYKQDWLYEHVSPGRQMESLREYYEMSEEDKSAYEDYDDYLFENGYNGELYVCFDEFLGAEFQDAGYMEYLLGPKLFEKYLQLSNETT